MARQADDPNEAPTQQAVLVPFLAIVPGMSIVFPWVFVFATLVESNIFTLAITLTTLFYGGKYLERAWGSKEFGKFLLAVGVVSNLVAYFTYIIWFALTGNVSRS